MARGRGGRAADHAPQQQQQQEPTARSGSCCEGRWGSERGLGGGGPYLVSYRPPLDIMQAVGQQASIAIARCLARLAARSCHHQLRGACQPAAPPAIVALPPALHGYRCRLRPLAAVRSEQSLGAEDSSLPLLAFGVAALDGLMPKPTQSWPIHSVLRHTATPVPLRPPPFPRTAKAKSWVQRCSSPPASHLLPDRIES